MNDIDHQLEYVHDIRLVHTSNLLAPMLDGKVKGKLDHLLRSLPAHNLQGFHNTWEGLVLEATILALHVLPNHDKIDLLMACLEAGKAADYGNVGIDVQFTSDGHVGAGESALEGREKDAFKVQTLDSYSGMIILGIMMYL